MAAASDGLSHHALFYRDQREYLTSIAGFARGGMARAEPVLIAIPGRNGRLVGDELREVSQRATVADMTETGRNPARIIPVVREFIDHHPGQRIRFIAEPAWPGRSAAELREASRHEALVNLAFAGTAASMLCLYDAGGLGSSVLGMARRTHPATVTGGLLAASSGYGGAGSMPAECDSPLSPPPARAEVLSYRTDLRPARRLVEGHACGGGLSHDRAASLVLAVSELAANTLRHTGAGGTLCVWTTRFEVLCQVDDQGWIADPLAGRRRRPAAERGHGLWVVNQVCDLVELRTGQAGTTVRLHMRRPGARDGRDVSPPFV
jgi:anti-sigma regulatory factor (Ser/Thr protein kinase)